MVKNPVLRFAPSPNGWLHPGHAFSALFTARAATQLSGTFLLRIEDIDPFRSKPEFDAGIRQDLAWLGLDWPEPVLRQSARMAAYAAAADALRRLGLLYPCFCSRREIAAAAAGTDPDGAPLYAGTCRNLARDESAGRLARGERAQWRLKMETAAALAGPLAILEAPAPGFDALWADAVPRPADPKRWGDAVLIRKETPTSYHLSVVIDDAGQGVTHITRGMDLFAATDLHVLLQRILGLPSPLYCHHRLLKDREGHKLAKSKGAASLRSLREAGNPAAEIRRALGFE
ncbi:MAG: tRNA glutamyl-Q(34) synthetase GluQRS [Rhodomicrobium sp.]